MYIYIKRISYIPSYKLSKKLMINKLICKKNFYLKKIKIYSELYHLFTSVKLINNLSYYFLDCLIN